jgi:hypothetical protein
MQWMYQRLRTLVLLLLQDYGRVHRTQLLEVVRHMNNNSHTTTTGGSTFVFTSDHVFVLLRQIARQKLPTHVGGSGSTAGGGSYWIPKVEDDSSFIRTYPTIMELHATYWKKQRIRFVHELELYHGS